ncbi:T9SS type A sorting domain-containing protein [Kordia sp.]|uniref:T9SS type A sorting domain-containing protein n=1 Tax=Kordia sp. TaxID=1965332 RepID=UPI003B5C5C81
MKKKYLFLTTFLILCISLHAQVNYYIDENGSATTESDAGTMNNPYSLDYFLNNIIFGIANDPNGSLTTVFLKGDFARTEGIFIGGEGNKKYNLTFDSWGNNNAVIKALDPWQGSFNTLFTLNESTDITVKNITFQGSLDVNTPALFLLNFKNNNQLEVDNVLLEQNWGINGVGMKIFGMGDSITVKNCALKNMGWTLNEDTIPSGSAISAGIIVEGNENDGPITNLVIENNTINDMINGFAENITVTGYIDGFRIENNVLSDNGNIGIAIAGYYPEVQDCDFSVNPVICDPMDPGKNQARNGIVRFNRVINSNQPDFAAAGIYCDGCRDVVIERNFVKGSDVGISVGCENGGSFMNEFSASNVKVINNITTENLLNGITIGSKLNEPNVSQGNALSTVKDCEIRNNTIYKNGEGKMLGSDFILGYQVTVSRSQNNAFFNNIVYIEEQSLGGIVSAVPFAGDPLETVMVENFEMSHNLFFADDGNQNNLVISEGSMLYNSTNSSFGTPDFIDVSNDNFRISNTSMAVNAGKPSTTVLTPAYLAGFYAVNELDYYENDRILSNTHIDIGAFESDATNLSVPNVNASDLSIQIYPNPITETGFLNIDNQFTGDVTMHIYSVFGRKIEQSITFKKLQKQHAEQIDFQHLSSGLYFVMIQIGETKQCIKVLKE